MMRASLLLGLARRGCARRHLGAQLAVAHTQHVQLHASAHVRSSAAAAAEASTNSNSRTNSLLARLDKCIAKRECAQALATLQQLHAQPPSAHTLQKLVVLLAKQKNAAHALRAYELLLSVYRSPDFVPDDYTMLASIHVVDACLRYRRLNQAVETYEEAFNQGVFLDLAAYDALLAALVAADRTFEAVAILNEIADEDDVSPCERSYLPLLLALVRQREYESAMDLLERGQGRGVTFTGETFDPLVECAEKEEEPTDALVMLLTYIEDIWEDAKLFEAFAEEIDDDDDDEDENDENDDESNRDDESNSSSSGAQTGERH